MNDFVLVVNKSTNKWQFDIITTESLSLGGPWQKFTGDWCQVPTAFQKKVEAFEKSIGRAIMRPSAFGNQKVMLGGENV